MFRLLNWIPGCRGPRYDQYYYDDSEKDSPLIPDITSPTFSHVPPPVRPIPESRYQRRLIDEDFYPVRRDFSYDTTKYRRYPMKEESFHVSASPPPEATPQPRVVSRGSSRRSHSSVARSPTYPNNSSQDNAARRRRIADETLAAIERGEIQLQGGSTYRFHDVVSHTIENTLFFPPDSPLATWSTSAPLAPSSSPAQLELCEGSTLQRARALLQQLNANAASTGGDPARIGVLSFASATKPGGGFLSGAHAQEESIARASTLYTSLVTPTANQYYELHKRDRRGGFYSHAMVFSPSVIVLRDDAGAWLPPYQIEVVTCAAVNAGVVRERAESPGRDSDVGARIESVMRERMARILFLFEQRGLRNIVLGSFGTGVFRNDVSMIADIWFDLLAEGGARFMHSFDRVVFGIVDKRTAERFKAVFESRIEAQNSAAWSRESSFGTPRTTLRVVG